MNQVFKDALANLIAENQSRWTPEQIALAEFVAVDLAELAARKLAGEAVDDKLVEAKASAVNIIASEALMVQKTLFAAITGAFEATLRRVLIGSGP